MTNRSATIMSPVGALTIVANDAAIVAIRWDTESDDRHPDAQNPVDRTLDTVAPCSLDSP